MARISGGAGGKGKPQAKPKPTPYVIPTPGGNFGPRPTGGFGAPGGGGGGAWAAPRPTPRPGPRIVTPAKPGTFGSPKTGGGGAWNAPPIGKTAGAVAGRTAGKTIAARPAPRIPGSAAAPTRKSAPVKGVGGAPGRGGRPVGSSVPGAGNIGGGAKPVAPVGAGGGSVEQMQSAADGLAEYMATATGAVQAELMPQLNDLNRQIAEMQARGERDLQQTDQRGRATQSDLGELFGRLGNFTGKIQEASTANYKGLQDKTSAAYEALKGALGSTYGAQTTASNDEMNRLGIAGTAPNANDRLGRDQKFLTGLAGVDQAAAVTGLGNSQNSFDQLMSMARGTAATEGAVRVGQSKRDTDRAMSDIRFELEQGTRSLSGKRGDVEAGRGEKIRQLAEAMEEKNYGRRVESEDRRFQRDLATKRFGLDKRQAEAALAPQPMQAPSTLESLKEAELLLKIQDQKAQIAQREEDEKWKRIFGGQFGGLYGQPGKRY